MKEFKLEKYLLSTALQHHTVDACYSVGGLICGERKLAIFLRYLAGGSYLDVADIYDVHENSLFHIIWEVVDWINVSLSFDYSLEDEPQLQCISEGFCLFSHGALKGCIGAIDGIAIKIKCSSAEVGDPRNYFS